MAIRDKLTAAVQPHLQPGEQLQAVFAGQTWSQWLVVVTGFIPFVIFNRYRVVAVTDRRIAVFDAGRWGMTKAKSLVVDLPRGGTLGPGAGIWHVIKAGNEDLRVHRRFFKDLAQADAYLTGPAASA
jgi:hypothetical protein